MRKNSNRGAVGAVGEAQVLQRVGEDRAEREPDRAKPKMKSMQILKPSPFLEKFYSSNHFAARTFAGTGMTTYKFPTSVCVVVKSRTVVPFRFSTMWPGKYPNTLSSAEL